MSMVRTALIYTNTICRLPEKRKGTLARSDRRFQGWAEAAAFYLDRVMGFNKKPPITGRIMTNKELLAFETSLKHKVKKQRACYQLTDFVDFALAAYYGCQSCSTCLGR